MFLLSASGDANNAFNDILNNTRWQGNMDTISPIVGIIDVGFTTYLTIIAFFIIMAAMSRNILAAGYCAFPKFFDQVHEAHMEVADQSWFNRFGTVDGWKSRFQEMNMSTIKKFFMRLVPDIKVLTDFEEGVYDFKSYFIRAIPQMLAVVCLGAFIYNGFYRAVIIIRNVVKNKYSIFCRSFFCPPQYSRIIVVRICFIQDKSLFSDQKTDFFAHWFLDRPGIKGFWNLLIFIP